jgi:hypothetical protein
MLSKGVKGNSVLTTYLVLYYDNIKILKEIFKPIIFLSIDIRTWAHKLSYVVYLPVKVCHKFVP